jgi:hypothetical protein
MVNPEETGVLQGVLHRMYPFVDKCTWTWGDVIRACMDPDCTTSAAGADSPMINTAVVPHDVLSSIMSLFLMAVSKEVQEVVCSFYPTMARTNANLTAYVLGNYDAATNRVGVVTVRKAKERHVQHKFGAHIVVRGIVVDDDTSMWIWQAVVHRFSEKYTSVPGGAKPDEFWGVAFDGGVYSDTGGLRMAYVVAPPPTPLPSSASAHRCWQRPCSGPRAIVAGTATRRPIARRAETTARSTSRAVSAGLRANFTTTGFTDRCAS